MLEVRSVRQNVITLINKLTECRYYKAKLFQQLTQNVLH